MTLCNKKKSNVYGKKKEREKKHENVAKTEKKRHKIIPCDGSERKRRTRYSSDPAGQESDRNHRANIYQQVTAVCLLLLSLCAMWGPLVGAGPVWVIFRYYVMFTSVYSSEKHDMRRFLLSSLFLKQSSTFYKNVERKEKKV